MTINIKRLQSLADVLATGNESGGNDLIILSGDVITGSGTGPLTIIGDVQITGTLIGASPSTLDEILAAGNTTNGNNLFLSTGDVIQMDGGPDVQVDISVNGIAAAAALITTTPGKSFSITAGDASIGGPGQPGGNLTFIAGDAGGSVAVGGDVTITGGVGKGALGGSINITSGASNNAAGFLNLFGANGSEAGGDVVIQAGDTSNINIGGEISLTGGRGGTNAIGNAGNGGPITLTGGEGGVAGGADGGIGGNIVLTGGVAGADRNGGAIQLAGGVGDNTGNGGSISIVGGVGGGTLSSFGGGVSIFGGGNTSGKGGSITIFGGTPSARDGGSITIQPGTSNSGATTFEGNFLNITGGTSNSNQPGGVVRIKGGSGLSSAARGGNVEISGGDSTAAQQGGEISLTGGAGAGGGAVSNGTAGGNITIVGGAGGDGTTSDGAGGDITITAGSGAITGQRGSVTIQGGLTGSSTGGDVIIQGSSFGDVFIQGGTNGNVFLGGANDSPVIIQAAWALTDALTPPSFGSSQNNYNPTGLDSCGILRVEPTANINLTGLVSSFVGAGRRIVLVNISTTNTLTLTQEDASSTDVHRFDLPSATNYTLNPRAAVELLYDGTTQRWRLMGL